jgi:hypothetical protein
MIDLRGFGVTGRLNGWLGRWLVGSRFLGG